jgi:hypothetical protein
MTASANRRAWYFNRAQDRLEIRYNDQVEAYVDANGFTVVNALVVDGVINSSGVLDDSLEITGDLEVGGDLITSGDLNGVTLPVEVNGPGTNGANLLTALESLGLVTDTSG